ncbi:MAG TPA: isoamylase [Candidatus Eisenbacteria bacterium]|jgi:glycogen operon protein
MDARDVVPPAARLAPTPGAPSPLGATLEPTGTNFAVYSHHATRMTLALFAPGGAPRGEIALAPRRHRTGDVWHVFVPGVRAGAEYGWRADSSARGPAHAFEPDALLLDPYAKGVAGSERWAEPGPRGRLLHGVVCDLAYDWRNDRPPATPLAATNILELHVRSFTRHASSRVRHPGTFAGLAEKIPYLRSLGVTAVQLMPVAEFDETDNPRKNPLTGERLLNAWGYSPLAFMAPRTAYAAAATAAGALREFRDMVRRLHRAGIEVILDVVFNHTGETDRRKPARSWRGLDRAGYFLLDDKGHDVDYTGCGHTFACSRPPAADLIVETLRFWARDMHVDGFRFDLASTLTRGEHGEPLDDPPLVRRIATDPALAHCKLIAEPWDIGLYHVGRFPNHGRFAELNGRFRDDVRDWLRGAVAGPGPLATRLGGSSDLYHAGRSPGHSVNFITSHDGFTLADLASYERKHNEANGEDNRDGTDDHRSWNGGAEGASSDPAVRAIRARQVRNAAVLLLLSRGAPLWLAGDEWLRSQGGNNNAWCHDGPAWWLDWDGVRHQRGFLRFVRGLYGLRREHAVLRGADWFAARGPGSVGWHNAAGHAPDWDHGGPELSMHLRGERSLDFLLLVNGGPHARAFHFRPPPAGKQWRLLVDTAAAPPADWTPLAKARPLVDQRSRALEPRSLLLLASR